MTLVTFEVADEAALPEGVAADTSCGDISVWAGDSRPADLAPDPAASPIPCD